MVLIQKPRIYKTPTTQTGTQSSSKHYITRQNHGLGRKGWKITLESWWNIKQSLTGVHTLLPCFMLFWFCGDLEDVKARCFPRFMFLTASSSHFLHFCQFYLQWTPKPMNNLVCLWNLYTQTLSYNTYSYSYCINWHRFLVCVVRKQS